MTSHFQSNVWTSALSWVSILIKLKEAGLKLKPVKCSFLQTQVKFLGHVVSADRVAPDPLKVQAVATFLRPQNLEELQRFLGMASYFRKFVRNFASIACPLHRLTEKSVKFQWTSECQQAFTTLKQRLTEAPGAHGSDHFWISTCLPDVGYTWYRLYLEQVILEQAILLCVFTLGPSCLC